MVTQEKERGMRVLLPDVQSERPEHEVPLTHVGISNFQYPITLRRNGRDECAVVKINASVDLPREQRGAHMSRFAEEIARAFTIPPEVDSIEGLVEQLAFDLLRTHHYAQHCTVTLETTAHMDKHLYSLFASYNTKTEQRILGVEVPGALACPCAVALTGGLSHNQRGILRIELQTNGYTINPEDLVLIAESSFSTPVRLLLKRAQEKAVVEAMHQNPKFVEDVVRDCVVTMGECFSNLWARIRCVSFESIHPYDCFAEWEGMLRSWEGESYEAMPD